ncbi:hypothetical protein KSP39_PZI022071 [Platanthera zijinensis]|uniref:WDR11 second beta-propeller domain-containing protein n=1 Tax=Platanthera zijinensis TaxID=2320716 RepID=A0AAP0AX31_9ASPA
MVGNLIKKTIYFPCSSRPGTDGLRTLILELDWLPMRNRKDEPLVMCIAGAGSSFRHIEIFVEYNDLLTSQLENQRKIRRGKAVLQLRVPISRDSQF